MNLLDLSFIIDRVFVNEDQQNLVNLLGAQSNFIFNYYLWIIFAMLPFNIIQASARILYHSESIFRSILFSNDKFLNRYSFFELGLAIAIGVTILILVANIVVFLLKNNQDKNISILFMNFLKSLVFIFAIPMVIYSFGLVMDYLWIIISDRAGYFEFGVSEVFGEKDKYWGDLIPLANNSFFSSWIQYLSPENFELLKNKQANLFTNYLFLTIISGLYLWIVFKVFKLIFRLVVILFSMPLKIIVNLNNNETMKESFVEFFIAYMKLFTFMISYRFIMDIDFIPMLIDNFTKNSYNRIIYNASNFIIFIAKLSVVLKVYKFMIYRKSKVNKKTEKIFQTYYKETPEKVIMPNMIDSYLLLDLKNLRSSNVSA